MQVQNTNDISGWKILPTCDYPILFHEFGNTSDQTIKITINLNLLDILIRTPQHDTLKTNIYVSIRNTDNNLTFKVLINLFNIHKNKRNSRQN